MASVPSHLVQGKPPLPNDLLGVVNGGLPRNLLADLPGGTPGRPDHMCHVALLPQWLRLVDRFKLMVGKDLSFTGAYRTYDQQVYLFKQRYQPYPIYGVSPVRWQNSNWYKMPWVATAARPGTSNHGWGLAIDVATGSPASPVALTESDQRWLFDNAPALGWRWENSSEPWHMIPAYYVATPQPEDEKMISLIRPFGYWNVYLFDGVQAAYVPSAAGAQELVDKGLIPSIAPGTPFDQKVVVIRNLETFKALTGFSTDPARGAVASGEL